GQDRPSRLLQDEERRLELIVPAEEQIAPLLPLPAPDKPHSGTNPRARAFVVLHSHAATGSRRAGLFRPRERGGAAWPGHPTTRTGRMKDRAPPPRPARKRRCCRRTRRAAG